MRWSGHKGVVVEIRRVEEIFLARSQKLEQLKSKYEQIAQFEALTVSLDILDGCKTEILAIIFR